MPKDKLPTVTAREAREAFGRAGFKLVRSKGSHSILRKPGHRYILAIPEHGHKTIKKGTLRTLIRSAGLTVEEFIVLLRE